MLDVDPVGLDVMDRKLLEAVLEQVRRRPGRRRQPRGGDRRGARHDRGRARALSHPAGLPAAHVARTRRDALSYRHFGLAAPDAARSATSGMRKRVASAMRTARPSCGVVVAVARRQMRDVAPRHDPRRAVLVFHDVDAAVEQRLVAWRLEGEADRESIHAVEHAAMRDDKRCVRPDARPRSA